MGVKGAKKVLPVIVAVELEADHPVRMCRVLGDDSFDEIKKFVEDFMAKFAFDADSDTVLNITDSVFNTNSCIYDDGGPWYSFHVRFSE